MKKVKINFTGQIAFIKSEKKNDTDDSKLYALVDSEGEIVWNGNFASWPESLVSPFSEKVDKLIEEYSKKIEGKEVSIKFINSKINEARRYASDTITDIEDLQEERANARRDKHLYTQFIKDLEDLQ